MKFRTLALILVLLMIPAALFGCNIGDDGNTDGSDQESESTTVEVVPGVDKKDYKTEFYMTIQPLF